MRWRIPSQLACVVATACVAQPPEPSANRPALGGDSPLVALFARVGEDTGVPPELLAALSYTETRLRFVRADVPADGGGSTDIDTEGAPEEPPARSPRIEGAPEEPPARSGLLGLPPDALARGARIAGVTELAARADPEASLRAGAALLRAAAPEVDTLDGLIATLSPELGGAVAAAFARGIDARDAGGRSVIVARREPAASASAFATASVGYAGAEWIPAASQNYQAANRGIADVDHLVIHTTEGSYAGTLAWFRNPMAEVSAHYVVRSADGHVAQMVDEQDIAWHDACFNARTIGIEHEGRTADPERWYTEAMYVESAKLAAYLADQYGIPKQLGSIVGHDTAPDCSTHADPGAGWDWDHYLDLVRTGGAPSFAAGDLIIDAPAVLTAGERAIVTVTLANRGNAAWEPDLTRVGTQAPADRESALFVGGDWLAPNRATAVDARVSPGATGTFTFDIVAPAVAAPVVFDEVFQLVEEGIAWFGPELHVVVQVVPRLDGDTTTGGCAAGGGAGSGAAACVMLALGAALRRRSRR